MLVARSGFHIAWRSRAADAGIGLGGGILGGLAGLSGVLPTIWAGVGGWGKDERRAVLQIFNTVILSVTAIGYAAAGMLTRELWNALLFAIPATLLGAFIGQRLYHRLDDRSFDRLVLCVLWAAGVLLMVSGAKAG
jgi:uncharacterized membrane protein YfcA